MAPAEIVLHGTDFVAYWDYDAAMNTQEVSLFNPTIAGLQPGIEMRHANQYTEIKEPAVLLPDTTMRVRETYDQAEISGKVISSLQNVKQVVVGREELLKQTLYALLTREHQLIYSRAGIAKSLYAETVFSQFEGAQTFKMQLSKKTPEEALVGGIIVEDMKRGHMTHNTEGSIIEADFAFLDEIFDANDPTLRSLLGVLNERLYSNGKQQERVRMHTAIATSNYLRNSEVTEAVVDRFLFQAYLLPDTDPYNLLRIDEAYERNMENRPRVIQPDKVSFDQLQYLADIVEGKIPEKRIQAPRHILFMKNLMIQQFMQMINEERTKAQKPELYVSPRTAAKTRDVLNASALLHGRNNITADDLDAVKYVVCTIGGVDNQERYFDKAHDSVLSGMSFFDKQIIDNIMEANEYYELLIAQMERGEKIPPTLFEQIKSFFNLQSNSELTFDRIKRQMRSLPTNMRIVNPVVNQLKDSAIARINYEEIRLKRKGDDGLVL